jgi:L-ribulose-5-phosphate 4-epimerase
VPFILTPEVLMPDLTDRQELVFLARCLWREGYADHLAGHITCNLGDGTFLCNPWLLTWDELRPSQVIRIDGEGTVVEGKWPAPSGIALHLELHRLRPTTKWAMHNHPNFGTIWSDMREVPPPMDQTSALGGGELVLVEEYEGPVSDPESAARTAKAIGDADLALLAGHGVFVLGRSAPALAQRAVALEARCRRAWYIRSSGAPLDTPLPTKYLDRALARFGDEFAGHWEAMVRRELRADQALLDDTY